MKKTKKLQVYETKRSVVSLSLSGKTPEEIAETLGIELSTVNSYITQALGDVVQAYENDSTRLLAKSYGRLELLIERLWEKAYMDGDKGSIDTIRNLINTQSMMLQRSQGMKIRIEGNPEKPIEHVFRHGSPEYDMAYEIIKNEPMILDDPARQFQKTVKEESGVELDIDDFALYEEIELDE